MNRFGALLAVGTVFGSAATANAETSVDVASEYKAVGVLMSCAAEIFEGPVSKVSIANMPTMRPGEPQNRVFFDRIHNKTDIGQLQAEIGRQAIPEGLIRASIVVDYSKRDAASNWHVAGNILAYNFNGKSVTVTTKPAEGQGDVNAPEHKAMIVALAQHTARIDKCVKDGLRAVGFEM